jgi:hypothetical protein
MNIPFSLLKYTSASALIGTALLAGAVSAKEFSSGVQATDVLELYTSEGCSSCPRADRWFSTLVNKQGVFKDFVPMAFHVDYWDYIGWKDRFASAEFSQRQRRHVVNGNTRQSYTPQFVANSQEWSAWLSGSRQWEPRNTNVGVLKVSMPEQSNTLTVSFKPQTNNWSTNAVKPKNYVLNVAVLGMGLSSDVTAGENHGVRLKHDFVVLSHQAQTVAAGSSAWQLAKPQIPQRGQRNSAIAVWLSVPGSQTVVQATGGYL